MGLNIVWLLCLFIFTYSNNVDCRLDKESRKFLEQKINSYDFTKVSKKCAEFHNNPTLFYPFMDSSSIIPNGLLNGNIYDLGVYSECLKLSGEYEGEKYHGRYCLTFGDNLPGVSFPLPYRRGRCMPSFCSNEDIGLVFNEGVSDTSCFTRAEEKKLSTGAILTITTFAIFGAITVMSTFYELYLWTTEKKSSHVLLTAFSAVSNSSKIFKTTSNQEQILCLNGLRVISMCMVIFFHEYQNTLSGPIDSFLVLKDFLTDKNNMYLFQASISVDTFFTITGILVAYQFFKNADKNEAKGLPISSIKDILMSYVHRYFRLTPVLAVMILFQTFLVEHIGEGPLNDKATSILRDRCKVHWWTALLYVQNYVNPMEDCVSQSWYLSVDMQLFILAPFFLIAKRELPKAMHYITVALLTASVVIPFYVSSSMKMPYAGYTIDEFGDEYMIYYYMKTHCRFGVYIFGMLCGELLYRVKKSGKKISLGKITQLGIWIIILAVIMFCFLGATIFMNKEKNIWTNALFNATFRQVFSVGICALVFMCVTGNGVIINGFLSLPIFQVLSKVSYSMYLVHYAVIFLRVTAIKNLRTFSTFLLFFDFCGDFMITLVISYFVMIIFEIPFDILDRYLFQGQRNVATKQK